MKKKLDPRAEKKIQSLYKRLKTQEEKKRNSENTVSHMKIGVLYLEKEHYQDEANQTVGAPAFTSEVLLNRRKVTARLTPLGEQIKEKVRQWFWDHYKIEVQLQFSKHAGCSMCPCSPGFNMRVPRERVNGYLTSRIDEDDQWNVWAEGSRLKWGIPDTSGELIK